jgi:hypothetical protein
LSAALSTNKDNVMITPAHVHIDLKAEEVRIDVDSEGGQNIYAFAVFK